MTIVSAVPSTVNAAATQTVITWNANENGSFSVRVGGSDCTSGSEAAQGTYATAPGDTTSNVPAGALTEGDNTIRVCVTDAATNTGDATITVSKDAVAPTISDRSPAPDASNVALGANVTVTFSEPMTATSINGTSFFLTPQGSGTPVAVTVSSNGATATLDPTNPLAAGTTYQVTVKGTVADANGNPLGSDTTWSFATIPPADTTSPVVTIVSAVPSTLNAAATQTVITWNANENGSFSVRVGGSDCTSGSEAAQGNYATAPGDTTSNVPAGALTEGDNTIRVCVTDAATNTGDATITVSKDRSRPRSATARPRPTRPTSPWAPTSPSPSASP